ncbi:hypothetical protein CY34DRAFT_369503 [Suillus luteus UH-Slu-Lm8-n1]|uniref:Secreted protein n=1 Tax=Suillus luteus UH-Slu-Lm8-n1 TaxID=930992 RepID=A0A0D0AYH5_9AGAM|nr:hypothetical protein CY34DRAFT_369503 [Suillus luteus UH-Slu-Lm8-n1]
MIGFILSALHARFSRLSSWLCGMTTWNTRGSNVMTRNTSFIRSGATCTLRNILCMQTHFDLFGPKSREMEMHKVKWY